MKRLRTDDVSSHFQQSGKTATRLRQECFEEMAQRFPVSSQTASDVNARTTAYMNCARSKGCCALAVESGLLIGSGLRGAKATSQVVQCIYVRQRRLRGFWPR